MFDGHGGREVAVYTEKHFLDYLKENDSYKTGRYEAALKQNFLKIDEELEKAGGKEELAVMKR